MGRGWGGGEVKGGGGWATTQLYWLFRAQSAAWDIPDLEMKGKEPD